VTTPERDADPPEADLPTSLVPRWLAWLVLLALAASAGVSVCQVLTGDAGGRPAVAGDARQAPPAR
jgi:hypothetical protein